MENGASCEVHEHNYLGQGQERNERRTMLVIGLTAVTMAVEITCGIIFGSMALLADGWHMASHAAALSITAAAYILARRHAGDARFCFGTGKIGELAGFASALLLLLIAVLMAYESVNRLMAPVVISFDQAIIVAVVGLAVNLLSAFLLREDHGHGHHHAHDDHDEHEHHDHDHQHGQDHNLRSAYLHVLADALTSVLAIGALVTGRFLGWVWMDPLMGIVGAVVIVRWSWGLLRDTGAVLLDMSVGHGIDRRIREALAHEDGARITDLHVWRVGPGHYAAIVAVRADQPRPSGYYKSRLGHIRELSHLTLEVNADEGEPASAAG